MGNCWLWYPDIETQREIVLSLKDEVLPLDTSLDRAHREIDLIREYRTRLIADAVRGKIDVRDLELPQGSEELEEKVEELEPLDEAAGELDEEALTGEVDHADD